MIWRFTESRTYHNHHLGETTLVGRQALALVSRDAYRPVLWDVETASHCSGLARSSRCGFVAPMGMWAATQRAAGLRPLANISLVWMLEEAEAVGLHCRGWQARFERMTAPHRLGRLRAGPSSGPPEVGRVRRNRSTLRPGRPRRGPVWRVGSAGGGGIAAQAPLGPPAIPMATAPHRGSHRPAMRDGAVTLFTRPARVCAASAGSSGHGCFG